MKLHATLLALALTVTVAAPMPALAGPVQSTASQPATASKVFKLDAKHLKAVDDSYSVDEVTVFAAVVNAQVSPADRRVLMAKEARAEKVLGWVAGSGSVDLFEQYLAATPRRFIRGNALFINRLEDNAKIGMPAAVGMLMATLDRQPATAKQVGGLLAKYGNPWAAMALVHDAQGRDVAVLPDNWGPAVGMFGDAGLRPALLKLLRDARSDRRFFAADALRSLADRRDVDALRAATRDPKEGVAMLAMQALAEITPPSRRAVLLDATRAARGRAAECGRYNLDRMDGKITPPAPAAPEAKAPVTPAKAPLTVEGLTGLFKQATQAKTQKERDAAVAGIMPQLTPAAAPVLWKMLDAKQVNQDLVLAALALTAPPADDEKLRQAMAKGRTAENTLAPLTQAIALRGDRRHAKLLAAGGTAGAALQPVLGALGGPEARQSLAAAYQETPHALRDLVDAGGMPAAQSVMPLLFGFATWKGHEDGEQGNSWVSGQLPDTRDALRLAPWQPGDTAMRSDVLAAFSAAWARPDAAMALALYPLLDRSAWASDRAMPILLSGAYVHDEAGRVNARKSANEVLAVHLDVLAALRKAQLGDAPGAARWLEAIAHWPIVTARPDLAVRVNLARASVQAPRQAIATLNALTEMVRDFSSLDHVRLPGAKARVQLALAQAHLADGGAQQALTLAQDAAKAAAPGPARLDAWRTAYQAAIKLDGGKAPSPRTQQVAKDGEAALKAYLVARDARREREADEKLKEPIFMEASQSDPYILKTLEQALAAALVDRRMTQRAQAAWQTLVGPERVEVTAL